MKPILGSMQTIDLESILKFSDGVKLNKKDVAKIVCAGFLGFGAIYLG